MLLHVQSASQPRLNRSSVNAGPEKVFLWSSGFGSVCVRAVVFDFVWRTLQIASEKATPKHGVHVSSEEVFFFFFLFPPLWFRASSIKLPLWEPAFPALPRAGCARPEGFGDEGERGPGFRVSQVCLLYTASGNNGRAKYLIYTPDPGTHLQIIKAGSWQRGESGNCNGCSQFIP